MNSVYIDSAVAASPIYIGPTNANAVTIGNATSNTFVNGLFNANISTSSVDVASTGTLNIGSSLTTGTLSIGQGNITTGSIYIGAGNGNLHTGPITIGTTGTATTIQGATMVVDSSSDGTINIGSSQTAVGSGINIGGNSNRLGTINVGGGGSGNVNLGNTTNNVNLTSKTSNIGITSLSNSYIGNGTSNSNGINTGVCSINKLQVGNTAFGNGVANGTAVRCIIYGTVAGGSTSGTVTISGAPTGASNPYIFASINVTTTTTPYFINVNPNGTNTFTYYKSFLSGTTINAASAESFNYMAIWF